MSEIVAIRFDVTAGIGTGHLRRSIAFGAELKQRGIQHYYVTSKTSVSSAISLGIPSNQIIGFHSQLGEQDWVSNLPGLTHVITDICHHERDQESVSLAVKSILSAKHVVLAVIDSMPPYHYQSTSDICPSFVITPYFEADKFRDVPVAEKWLSGVDYAILDKAYCSIHKAIEHSELSIGDFILICCGGSDPNRHSEYILQELLIEHHPQVQIKVVIGNYFEGARIKFLHKLAEQYSQFISFVFNRNNVADLISNCGVMLGTVGLIRYEAACLGKSSFLLQSNLDYENYLRNFSNSGMGEIFFLQQELERERFRAIARKLCLTNTFLEFSKPNYQAFQKVDGLGTKRILDELLDNNE